jgi:hypothetical protein
MSAVKLLSQNLIVMNKYCLSKLIQKLAFICCSITIIQNWLLYAVKLFDQDLNPKIFRIVDSLNLYATWLVLIIFLTKFDKFLVILYAVLFFEGFDFCPIKKLINVKTSSFLIKISKNRFSKKIMHCKKNNTLSFYIIEKKILLKMNKRSN